MSEWIPVDSDYDYDEPFICPLSGMPCVRAFCEDYGCADKAGVPLDENDFAAGTIDPDELMPRLPRPAPGGDGKE